MKRLILLTLTLLTISVRSFGQICGTPHPVNPPNYPSPNNAREGSTAFCIDIFFHIVRNSNGTNAFTLPDTDAITRELNEVFSPHHIVINNAGTSFINNSSFVNIDNSGEAASLGQTNNQSDAINYYIVETLWNVGNGFITGTANSIPSNNLVIRSDRVLTSTSSHELGHCLNLLHTFETAYGAEAINGSNCATAGDLVCDTPADQNMGTANGYNPDLTNIMSYYSFRNHFTDGQAFRMRYAISTESILQNVNSTSCTSISAINTICYSPTTTVALANLDGATTTWTSSGNVQIVSSNNSSATIRAKYSYSSGDGWVTATMSNGITHQEDFHVGKAETDEVLFRNNGAAVSGYFCSSHINNEFEILPNVPDATYQVRIRSLSTNNIVAGPYNFTGNIATLPTNYNYTPGWYLFEVRGTNSCGTTNWSSWEVEFVDCTLGGGGGEMEYRVYPNPSSNTLTIENNHNSQINNFSDLHSKNYEKTATYELCSMNAEVLLSGSATTLTTLDVSTLKKGRYILKIYQKNGIETHHIVIK